MSGREGKEPGREKEKNPVQTDRVRSKIMKEFITDTCKNAGKILSTYFCTHLEHTEKKDAGFVTQADIESESYIINEITKAFPDSDIIAEESGENIHGNPLKWIIDPLDGTTNFGNGVPFFAVSIALEDMGQLTHGAVYNPVTDEFFYAERGKGAFLNNDVVTIASKKELSRAVLATGDAYYRGSRFEKVLQIMNRAYQQCRAIRLPGSVALSLAYMASGKFDGFWLDDCNYWDIAAGIVMAREAGGMIVNFQGLSLDNDRYSSLVVTNQFLLPEILRIL